MPNQKVGIPLLKAILNFLSGFKQSTSSFGQKAEDKLLHSVSLLTSVSEFSFARGQQVNQT